MPRRLKPSHDKWIMTDDIEHHNRISLICFHHAGGDGHIFQPWLEYLPPWVQIISVSLPGRSALFHETPYTDLNHLIPDLAIRLKPWLKHQYVMYGHSLGALLAFEVARSNDVYHFQPPKHLFLAGREAPCLPQDKMEMNHLLPDEAFIHVLRDKAGTPEEILRNKELIQLLLPSIRADFQIVETYQYAFKNMLHCPITVFAGSEEKPSDEDFAAWKYETTGIVTVKRLPGGHFFVKSEYKYIINHIIQKIKPIFSNKVLLHI